MQHNSTEQNLAWFCQRYQEGKLKIKPPFQRGPVWTARQQSALVESILMDLPVPQIFMQQTTTADGDEEYAVVDGQQRIRAILAFTRADGRNGLQLSELESGSQWFDLTFDDLADEDKERFYGYRLSVRMLDNATEDQIRDMFRRLNKFLTPLNRQELRNATYSGPFIALAEELANNDYWLGNGIFTPENIRRMRDIEFVSELLIGVMHGPSSGRPDDIDEYYAQYEVDMPTQGDTRRQFNRALDIMEEVLPDIKRTRWRNKTDFYTLFVAIAGLLRDHRLPDERLDPLRDRLNRLEKEIGRLMDDEDARVPQLVIEYVENVQRGTSDKARRGGRHVAMLRAMSRYFVERRQR